MEFKAVDTELLLAIVAFTVWLVRLEGLAAAAKDMAKEVQKDVDQLRIKHESLDSKIVEQLGAVRESLARLEGRLGIKQEGD